MKGGTKHAGAKKLTCEKDCVALRVGRLAGSFCLSCRAVCALSTERRLAEQVRLREAGRRLIVPGEQDGDTSTAAISCWEAALTAAPLLLLPAVAWAAGGRLTSCGRPVSLAGIWAWLEMRLWIVGHSAEYSSSCWGQGKRVRDNWNECKSFPSHH